MRHPDFLHSADIAGKHLYYLCFMVYRFRVTYEDHEDVFRDIEIKTSQGFFDFHTAIQQAIGFDQSKEFFFFSSDDYWRRIERIPFDLPAPLEKNRKQITIPKSKAIADFVNEPHQKFIYLFDPEKQWVFWIELLKIMPEDKTVSYPRCVKISGNAPKQYKETVILPPEEEEKEKLLSGKNENENEETNAILLKGTNEEFVPACSSYGTEDDSEESPGDGLESEGGDAEKTPDDRV